MVSITIFSLKFKPLVSGKNIPGPQKVSLNESCHINLLEVLGEEFILGAKGFRYCHDQKLNIHGTTEILLIFKLSLATFSHYIPICVSMGHLQLSKAHLGEGEGNGALVNFYWVCAANLLQSILWPIIDPTLVAFGLMVTIFNCKSSYIQIPTYQNCLTHCRNCNGNVTPLQTIYIVFMYGVMASQQPIICNVMLSF